MTALLFFLAAVAWLGTAVFGIWLTIQAFRTSTGWGLAALFLPFALWIHAFMHWDECKKPFIGQFASFGAALLFVVLGFVAAPSLADQAADLQASMEQVRVQQPAFQGEPPAPPAEPASTAEPPTDRPVPVTRGLTLRSEADYPTRSRKPFGEITLSAAADHVGDRIRITDSSGNAVEGDLITARNDRLVIEKRISAGVVTFEIPNHEIDAVEVLRH